MLLVDINIPILGKTYDFQVDETVSIEKIIIELVEMLGIENRSDSSLNARGFFLCSPEKEETFQRTRTLKSYGIQNGCRLMLI